jgi:predicted enzyme related to lactoylglutathione lyase
MPAPIIHVEWKSANFARTSEFYARVFKWKTEQNGSGSYMKLDEADGPSVGWVRADLVQAPGPITFLSVDDLAATLDEIENAGGRVLVRSLPFAGGGEIALFADPDDNVLGLWRRKAGAAEVAAAKPAGDVATAAKPAVKAAKAPKAPAKPKKPK